MSELKARTARSIADEEEILELGADCPIEQAQVYLKSEADKVIAEKNKEIMELNAQVNGFHNRANLWQYNAVEEHKKFLQIDLQMKELKKACKDKDEKIDLYKKGWEESDRINASIYAEIRHQKYKRCLAMALLWLERSENSTDLENELVSRKRCCKWMELAEKFKTNLTAM